MLGLPLKEFQYKKPGDWDRNRPPPPPDKPPTEDEILLVIKVLAGIAAFVAVSLTIYILWG